ncbi:uncharacterized protein LOC125004310 isoform X2 [Mugil cephalus]|uniref:uncharacterized protein LOC125004310 isoform X2 n=1 Tax=Mugil cephalus TaxID=48193 RepID=UPI001FB65B82|nr:uncharacterized protein LOC125004310 isoform X2 [Mugil cephalus]
MPSWAFKKSINYSAMSCNAEKLIRLFLFVIIGYFYTFPLCYSADLNELRPEPGVSPGDPSVHFSAPKLLKTGFNFGLTNSSWTIGKVSTKSGSSSPDSEDGYQGDFTGFHGLQGKISGLIPDSSPHFSEWQTIQPLVKCDNNVMIITASGQGAMHLQVNRVGDFPISIFSLPPYCGYSLKTAYKDLEMKMPYDACYITQENGSYVLPILWRANPLKFSCPMWITELAPMISLSDPLVFCSPDSMVVQIHGQEKSIPLLGVTVSGTWGPFVSEQCASFDSQSQELTFFISYSAPCITSKDGLHLQLLLDGQDYMLSCPPHTTSLTPTPSPGDPQFPYPIPYPVSTGPTTTPPLSPPPLPSPPPPSHQTPSQEQIAQFPHYPYYFYLPPPTWSNTLSPGNPLVAYIPDSVSFAPTSSPSPPTQEQIAPVPEYPHPYLPSPPWSPTPSPSHPQFLHLPGPVSPVTTFPSIPAPLHQLPTLGQIPQLVDYHYYPSSGVTRYLQLPQVHQVAPKPTRPPQPTHGSPSGQQEQLFLYPTDIKYHFAISPATQPPKPPKSPHYSQYHLQLPYYPEPTAAPVTQQPAPLPSMPQSPVDPQYQVDPPYLPNPVSSYYPHWSISYTKPSTDSPSSQFHPQRHNYLPLPALQPLAKGEFQKPAVPQTTCPPHLDAICSFSVSSNFPNYLTLSQSQYHPPYLPVPQYPQIPQAMTTQNPATMTPPTTTTAWTNLQDPYLKCLIEKMSVFLPYAHTESIQLREQKKGWVLLSSVSPHCGYMLQMPQDFGVILHSPLPACHSQIQTPSTISLPIRFWDRSIEQYRTLDPQCPYLSTLKTPAPVTPAFSKSLPTTTEGPVVAEAKIFCSSHHMDVELPAGPISGIAIKDTKRHLMNLQDFPAYCRYSASKGKDGKIHLILQLHSVCHMSVKGNMYTITVVYMTATGRKEAQFSCPVVIPVSGQECNLPSEHRLPCGSSSVSQPQCLSMGCCFNKHPPACYYPMDECTIDRHFVFSVPASLTEPPLSPALLVAATDTTCKPQRVIADYALFKIPMDGCGTHRVMVGKTVVYMVEIINKVQTLSLNYGTITRDSPVRLLVECRLSPGSALTVSYVVKTPTISPEVQSQGVFGVQLRIAEDGQYSSYYPQYHQPLQMLLGKPLYLEVRLLNSPDPSLVLLVHYCLAYPRSGKAVWVLLYNGCPNPLDPALSQTLPSDPQPSTPKSQTRRFTITTFQFLPDGEFKDPNEEMYFMCSTEICSPHEGPCVEGCFGQ